MSNRDKPKLYFIEPSKVGLQHLALIQGFLNAIMQSNAIGSQYELHLRASSKTITLISQKIKEKFIYHWILVMNPEKRRLILKTFVEFFIVFYYMLKSRSADKLLISCILPTTLCILEFVNKFMGKSNVYVVLHGEIDGLFTENKENILRIGFWSQKWMQTRPKNSSINLVVIDDFIFNALVEKYPEKISKRNLFIAHYPLKQLDLDLNIAKKINKKRICFVGYRTKIKGYSDYCAMANSIPDTECLAIGGGVVENVRTCAKRKLENIDDFFLEIAACNIAVFPYPTSYIACLASSAMDALNVGTHIIALDRPFFQSLANYFGAEKVTICPSIELLLKRTIEQLNYTQKTDLASINNCLVNSKYGLESVKKDFEYIFCSQSFLHAKKQCNDQH